MTILGFCTHFSETDDWAFSFALNLARSNQWQLTICHWLSSPFKIRRDIVQDDLFDPRKYTHLNPQLLTKLEYQLREFYDPKLGDFTDAAFRLCEGQYQVELVRCLRKNLLNLVVMGYQSTHDESLGNEDTLTEFADKLPYPMVIVGKDGPGSFFLNSMAATRIDELRLPEGKWQIIEHAPA